MKETEKTRLNKFIASCGYCSRRKADELISEGVVKVNDVVVKEMGFLVSSKDIVKIKNEVLKNKKFEYVKFNKPAGYLTTCDDENNRKTIYSFFPEHLHHLKPIGRLDKDSSGLLLLTNDGELINKLTHPSVHVPKLYRVVVEGKITQSDLDIMEKGIEIEKGKTAYAYAEVVDLEGRNTVLMITLYQGLNRQIRKMADYIGHPVISLKRIQHANIELAGLKRGEYKFLKPSQVREIYNYLSKLERKEKIFNRKEDC